MPRYRALKFAALLTLATLLAAPRQTEAQSPADRAVRAVVDSFFDAVAREKWESAAALVDRRRFEVYFKQAIRNARMMLPQPPMTVEAVMARDSTMPRVVAEWEVAQMARYKRTAFGDMSYEFAGVTTLQALFALTVPDAEQRWLQAQDLRVELRQSRVRAGCPLDDLSPPYPGPKHVVLTAARSDDSTAYVVHGNDNFAADPGYLVGGERVMILHRSAGRWRIEPRRDLLRPGNMGIN